MGFHVRQEKFLNLPYVLQTAAVAHKNIQHRTPCDSLLALKPHYFQYISSHRWHAFNQWITNSNLYLTYSTCFMNSQVKTKEHYVIWYLMITEMLRINLLPPWNFLCAPCTHSCMHIQKSMTVKTDRDAVDSVLGKKNCVSVFIMIKRKVAFCTNDSVCHADLNSLTT